MCMHPMHLAWCAAQEHGQLTAWQHLDVTLPRALRTLGKLDEKLAFTWLRLFHNNRLRRLCVLMEAPTPTPAPAPDPNPNPSP